MTSSPRRAALALGTVGALGDELLSALVASPGYQIVHVALKQSIASSAPKYHPWPIGSSAIEVDDAFLCVCGPDTLVPRASPLVTYDASQVLEGAGVARRAGARRLIVVAPLSALLQMNAAAMTVSSQDEFDLVDMHFETLLIVRPTREETVEAGPWLGSTLRTLGKMALDIMLPSEIQALRPRTAALAILTVVQRCPPGVHVIGARALLDIVAESMPALLPKRTKVR